MRRTSRSVVREGPVTAHLARFPNLPHRTHNRRSPPATRPARHDRHEGRWHSVLVFTEKPFPAINKLSRWRKNYSDDFVALPAHSRKVGA
jgi:hypothetical protein